MIVTQERFVSDEAARQLSRALKYSNLTPADVAEILAGHGWMIWNCGNLSWVLTMANDDDEIEVLLCGGKKARECIAPWLEAMLEEPAHHAKTIRIDGRKGWSKLLTDFEHRDGVLYLKVPNGQAQNN